MIVVDGVEMVDVHEAARLVARSPETVRRWVWSGRLTARRSGRKLLVSKAQVMAQVPGRPDAAPARPGDLATWLATARRSRPGHVVTGTTAADLVLEDRRDRQTGPTDASR